MTTVSEPAVPAPRGAAYYVLGAFAAPRSRVRELMAEPRLGSLAWRIVLTSAVVSATAGVASDYVNYRYRGGGTYFLPIDYAIPDMLIWAAIEFAIFIGGFFLARFLWSYLFGFRAEERGVRAAAAMATCPAIVLDPVLEVVFQVTDADAEVPAYLVVFVVYALISAVIIALYYGAALAISYIRAAALSLANMVIYLTAAIAIVTAILFFPILWIIPAAP